RGRLDAARSGGRRPGRPRRRTGGTPVPLRRDGERTMTGEARLKIGILEGDDIGREIVPASGAIAKAAAARAGLSIDWRPLPNERRALELVGHTLPDETMAALPNLDGWILGPIGHRDYPKVKEAVNPHPILRKSFDLFANVRPTRSYPGIGCLYDD